MAEASLGILFMPLFKLLCGEGVQAEIQPETNWFDSN